MPRRRPRPEAAPRAPVEPPPPPPRTRGECLDGPRPCPCTTCRYHLDRQDPRQHPAERKSGETCALDVADRNPDGLSLEEIGAIVGVTRERIRQIEAKAEAKLGASLPLLLDALAGKSRAA